MKKLILLMIFALTINFSYGASVQEDCFEEMKNYVSIINESENYNSFKNDFSSLRPISEPFMNLQFATPITYIRFNNMGTPSSLQVNTWPTYKEYNFYEMYVDNPSNFDWEFIGCGYMRLKPEGEYNFTNLNSNLYGRADLDSYQIIQDTNTPTKRVFRTKQMMLDVDEDDFLEWDTLRIYMKDSSLYFKPYNYIDMLKTGINNYQSGDPLGMYNYVKNVVQTNEPFVFYLSDYAIFNLPEYESGISDDKTPTEFSDSVSIETFNVILGEMIYSNEINDIIDLVNVQGNELKTYGFIASYINISNISQNGVIEKKTFEDLQNNLQLFLTIINRVSLFQPIDSNNLIYQNHIIKINENLNNYLQEKHCKNPDFSCNAWGICTSSLTNRIVNRNRNCIGIVPKNNDGCTWVLHKYGPTSTVTSGCTTQTYRTVYQRDLYNNQISDYCGIFNLNQWIGHTKSYQQLVGTTDNCDTGGGDSDGSN